MSVLSADLEKKEITPAPANERTESRARPRTSPVLADQLRLEDAIVRYQSALAANRTADQNKAYRQICAIYPPIKFMRPWFCKYRHLFDTREDFVQDYLITFCVALAAWKPRETRGESRFAGSGNFANFFWSALQNSYINRVKSDASGKRNTSMRCPICSEWCNPLSTHLLNHHHELMWEKMEEFGINVENLDDCPFCKSFKMPRNNVVSCDHRADEESPACTDCKLLSRKAALRKHLTSMHSGFLFDRFRDLFPEYDTVTSKPASVNFVQDESGDGGSLYDFMSEDRPAQKLLSLPLSTVQRKIVERVFSGNAKVAFDPSLYNCDLETFESELIGLRETMTLIGMGA